MSDTIYKVNTGAILSSEIWREASRDELRVLTYLIARSGTPVSPSELARECGISAPRASSALSLWRESGVISEGEARDGVKLEFGDPTERGGIDEEESKEVAREIRDDALADLISDIASLLQRPALSTQEIKHVTALRSQLALPDEYVLTLAAYMAETGKLTPKRLADTASRLVERGVDNMEALEKYIEDSAARSGAEWEFRKLLGIWGRNLSKSEEAHFARWSGEYGYSVEIVGIAYDITAVNTGKASLAYMNKLLTSWHEAGCKTVAEVEAYIERERATKKATPKKGGGAKKQTAKEPTYGDFDSDDALMKALARSYGSGEDKKD